MTGKLLLHVLLVALELIHRSATDSKRVDEFIRQECCQAIAYADCWGFRPGADSAASIQAAIDCPLAHTVVVKNMGTPWIVGLPHLQLPVVFKPELGGTYRAALNFSNSDQLIIFQPGVVVEALRWSFHGARDNHFLRSCFLWPVPCSCRTRFG